MYRIYKNILHSFPGGFKILVNSDTFRRILWLISWNLQDDQGGITCMINSYYTFFCMNSFVMEPVPVADFHHVHLCFCH